MSDDKRLIKRQPPVIGLFIDWIDSPFQFRMMEGIAAGAGECGINLFCFVGGAIRSPNSGERARNFIYDYATGKVIDGLIIMSTPVGNFVSIDTLNRFRERFVNIPVVSIAQPLENSYTVQIDNYTGLKKLVCHLIQDHKYKNIAVIKGPENNLEAQERFRAYKDALEENGVPCKKELIASGLFHELSGYDATINLLSRQNIKIDAIVAVNDDMAFGAIKALQEKNLNVPYDIAVVGFDDQLQCSYFSPSLSTVKMPIFELGFQAVVTLNNIFRSQPVDRKILLPTRPVIRESCGCIVNPRPIPTVHSYRLATRKIKKTKTTRTITQSITAFFHEGLQARCACFTDDEIVQLASLFTLSVEKREPENFINYFYILMNKHKPVENEMDYIFRFFLNQKSYLVDLFETQDDKSEADEQIRIVCEYILSYIEKNLSYNKIKLEREFIRFRNFGGDLVVCTDTDQISDTLLQMFPSLDISTFYLSLFEEKGLTPDSSNPLLQMILAYRNNERMVIENQVKFDPYETLVPACYLSDSTQWSLIIEPLFFGATKLGLAVFDMKINRYIDYVMRRRVLNDALNYVVYVQRILNQSRYLEKANSDLSVTLNILKETQDKLLQSEKMSIIGSLVAGISHEISTPVGISITASSHLVQITRDITSLYTSNNIKKSDFEHYLNTAQEISELVLGNLKRASELIGSFKQVAVDQSIEEKRRFNARDYIEQILLSLKPAFRKMDLRVEVDCEDNLELESFPGAIYQIITNLIMNSLIHGYDKGQRGRITIRLEVINNQALLTYADDGKGISSVIIDKIFDPFFTTRRGQGGTGLGLHIVNNLVCQKLNGSIKCTSRNGEGAVFTISFPLM